MERFELLVVLLSFVYALALTHLLGSIAAMLLDRGRTRFSLVQALWMLAAVMLLFNNWLSLEAFRGAEWSAGLAAWALMFAIVQYVACALVSPRPARAGAGIDMAAHHARHGRLFKAAFVLTAAMAMAGNLVAYLSAGAGAGPALAAQTPVVLMMGVTLVALWRREAWVQFACSGVLILVLAAVVFI